MLISSAKVALSILCALRWTRVKPLFDSDD
jgi:hypothetical protein